MRKITILILLSYFSTKSFCQDYYKFRNEEHIQKGFSVTPIVGITIKPEGGSALSGILKADYTFGKFVSAGVAYVYLSNPTDSYGYIGQLAYPEHSGYLTVGGQYPFDNGWFSLHGTAGLGYIFSEASTVSSYFDLGIGFKVLPAVIIQPKLIFVQNWPIFGIGCQFKF